MKQKIVNSIDLISGLMPYVVIGLFVVLLVYNAAVHGVM